MLACGRYGTGEVRIRENIKVPRPNEHAMSGAGKRWVRKWKEGGEGGVVKMLDMMDGRGLNGMSWLRLD